MDSRLRQTNSRLTSGTLVLGVEKRSTLRPLLFLLCLMILGGAGFYAYTNKETFSVFLQAPQLLQENRALRDELEQARLNQEIEVSTRQELERQITTLNEQLKEDKAELEFLRSASGAAGKP